MSANSAIPNSVQRSLVEQDLKEGIRIGQRIGFRQGVAVTLAAGAVATCIAVIAMPEVRGKAQEAFSRARRRAHNTVFRLRHKDDVYEEE